MNTNKKEYIEFKYVISDTLFLPMNEQLQESYLLFQNGINASLEKIIRQEEKKIIQWLIHNENFKYLLFEHLELHSEPFISLETIEPIFSNISEGEIDIIIIPKDSSTNTISIECKRIVEKIGNDGELIFNRKYIEKISSQANRNFDLGFNKNYVCFIIEVDCREPLETNVLFQSSSDNTLKTVANFPGRDKLKNEIGIIIVEIVQLTNKSFKNTSKISLGILKQSTEQEQPKELTKKINILLNNK